MSKLLDNNEVSILPKTSATKTSLFSLGADLDKYSIMEEKGKARNLNKLDLKGSIYDKD
jgi:hypothetical protein